MEEWEWLPPQKKLEKVTARPWESEQDKMSLQLEESGTTDQSEETMVATKVKRHPASGPSLQRTTTQRLPSVRNGTTLSRSTQLEP